MYNVVLFFFFFLTFTVTLNAKECPQNKFLLSFIFSSNRKVLSLTAFSFVSVSQKEKTKLDTEK